MVPGSTQKVFEEGEQILYTVTVLRGQYQVRCFGGRFFYGLAVTTVLGGITWWHAFRGGRVCLNPLRWSEV